MIPFLAQGFPGMVGAFFAVPLSLLSLCLGIGTIILGPVATRFGAGRWLATAAIAFGVAAVLVYVVSSDGDFTAVGCVIFGSPALVGVIGLSRHNAGQAQVRGFDVLPAQLDRATGRDTTPDKTV